MKKQKKDETNHGHIALALQQEALLWTGDMQLYHGLTQKGFLQIVSTQDLATRIMYKPK
jgi:hypothetical protein